MPLAAQLACTPLVAAISGQVSLVAVAANLLVAPAVGPATVLGLAGGVAGSSGRTSGRWVAAPAAWCAAWIIAVARKGADLPVAAVDWSSGPVAVAVLPGCAGSALAAGAVLARRAGALALGGGDGGRAAGADADAGLAASRLGDGGLRRRARATGWC